MPIIGDILSGGTNPNQGGNTSRRKKNNFYPPQEEDDWMSDGHGQGRYDYDKRGPKNQNQGFDDYRQYY